MMLKKENLASRLRHRISIEQPVETPDDGGGFTTTWENMADLWAEIKPERGRETLEDFQLRGTRNYKITIRYIEGITTKMRVKFGSRFFNIRAVINSEEYNEMLELTAEEGVAI